MIQYGTGWLIIRKVYLPGEAALIGLTGIDHEHLAFFLKDSKGEGVKGVAGAPGSHLLFHFFL